MLGWERLAAVRPSRLKRAPMSVSAYSGLSSLTAMGRSSTSSRPRNTVDIPPEPISRSRTNLSVSLITRVIIGGSGGECYGRGREAPLQAPAWGGSDGLDALVIQPVELPLPVLDNADPGAREQLLPRAAVQPDLERHLRLVPGHRRARVLGEVHIVEIVDPLLLSPLLGGADLPLQA